MKRSMFLALAGAILVSSGCASLGPATRANHGFNADVDVGKVIAVNQWAQTKGATVVWVNYPQKSRTADASSTVN